MPHTKSAKLTSQQTFPGLRDTLIISKTLKYFPGKVVLVMVPVVVEGHDILEVLQFVGELGSNRSCSTI
jgi:hypothetical protein